jgi:hypothetical protein
MASQRSLSLVLAMLATVLLMAWNLLHDQFFGSVLISMGWLGLAVALGALAVRAAWITPIAEDASPRS